MASASPENIASEKQRRLRKQDKEGNYGEQKNTRQKMLAGPRANRRCSGIIWRAALAACADARRRFSSPQGIEEMA